jgi:hypothetical protein
MELSALSPQIPEPRMKLVRIPLVAAAVVASLPSVAHASLFHGETLDAIAMGLAWFVLLVVPIGVIVLFWLVHVMPEKIAHKRHHPQTEAITTLCLLSLVFGGLLWPVAWLWAYTKPIGYRIAYGTDKHEDYFADQTEKVKSGELLDAELDHLRTELDAMAAKGALPLKLKVLREDLAMLKAGPPAIERKVETA